MTLFFSGYCRTPPARTAFVICIAVLTANCQNSTTRPMANKPAATPTVAAPVAPASLAAAPAVVSSAPTAPSVSFRTPLRDQPSFALARVVSGIKRGTTIAKFPKKFGGICNASYVRNATLDWATGKQEFGDWRSEFGDIFFDALRDKGVNVVGDPKALFEQGKDAQSAEYLVGARIRNLDGKFCEPHRWMTRRGTGRYKGEFSIRVEWSVYSTLSKRTVARFETQGYFRQRKAKSEGILMAFFGAFTGATENLLKTRQFVDLIERKPGVSQALARPAAGAKTIPDEAGEFSPVEIEIGRAHV